ncbi:hypothetical protein Tco_1198577 [Tanacetum coccineum]
MKLNQWSLFPSIKPLHQFLHYPLLIIDLIPPKPVSPPVQELIFTATTTTLPPPPPLPQSTTDSDLANRVTALEKRKHHDLYSKIDKQVNEVVKEFVYNALQAPLRKQFKDLSEVQMKEILHDRMFENGSYKSHPDHATLYEALELSMQCDNNDKLHEALATSWKRRRDDQNPPPPPPKDSDRI